MNQEVPKVTSAHVDRLVDIRSRNNLWRNLAFTYLLEGEG